MTFNSDVIVNKRLLFAYFDLENNAMYWYTKSGTADVVYKYQIASKKNDRKHSKYRVSNEFYLGCGMYDCLTCSQDQNYCGFCSTSRACSLSKECAVNDWAVDNRNYICPGTSVNTISFYSYPNHQI